ncbi:MAG: filamentous hemagglutinin N-terminal domain-containing protein, partial [Gaiellaceae bacterium]
MEQSSRNVLIDWKSFSVGPHGSVTFEQPGSSAIALNRVTGGGASNIQGGITANGRVWIVNPNGVLFGGGSQVHVGSLIATTSDIADGDFANGDYDFSRATANPKASVVNRGAITASGGGSAVLSGSRVRNAGVVSADLGTAVLGGADAFTVDFEGDNLLRYQVTAPVASRGRAIVSNAGTVSAAGGTVLLTARAAARLADAVVNNTGTVEATSVSAHDGEIELSAGPNGTVNAGGAIDASAREAGVDGGRVRIKAGTVNLAANARVTASGGRGGHGGRIETSGRTLALAGRIDAGRGGRWTVDPVNLTVDAGAASTIAASLDGGTNVALRTRAHQAVGPGVQSSGPGDITVAAALSWNSNARLTLDAFHSVLIGAPVTVMGTGKLNLLTDHGGSGGSLAFDGGNVRFLNLRGLFTLDGAGY